MPSCKNCKSEKVVKSGFIRGKQRYQCKNCGCNFVEGDSRTNEKTALKRPCAYYYIPSARSRSASLPGFLTPGPPKSTAGSLNPAPNHPTNPHRAASSKWTSKKCGSISVLKGKNSVPPPLWSSPTASCGPGFQPS